MSAPVIVQGVGNGRQARVTDLGQLVVAPLGYDDVAFVELAVDDTAYNFYGPVAGKQFVITGIVAKADKQVSTTVDATVVVYEASGIDETVVSKVLYQDAMVSGDRITLLPLNILASAGVWINAKTSDDDVHMTIMGYYVDISA